MMYKFFTTFFFISLVNYAFAQFTDDFSDGDFTNNPAWFGQSSKFEATSNELHLNDTAAGEAYLITNSKVIHTAIWEFRVKMDHSPSGSNFSRVFLMSDNSDLTAPLNGYYVEIGNKSSSTSDDITLYRLDGTSKTKLIDGADGVLNPSSVNVMIKVERDAVGGWSLYTDTSGVGGTSYILEGTASDNTYSTSNYFGVYCEYTSSRADNYYFDDFSVSGTTYQDSIPPLLNSVTVISQDSLELKFSENIKKSTGENTANYSANNSLGNPTSATFDPSDSSVIRLAFGSSFQNGVINTLTVSGIMDNENNTISSTQKDFIYFIVVPASFHDIVINEIFPDPSPQVGLPAFEFVELYNASNNVYDLKDWNLKIGSSSKNIDNNFILVPGAHLILCHEDDTFSYKFYGDVIGLNSLSLTNSGGDLYLSDNNGTLIDEVHYEDSWYNDNDKKDGGYTLELINPEHPCQSPSNWTASENSNGGTPGSQNSVYDNTPDSEGASISKVNIISNSEIEVILSETMDSISVANGTYSVNNGLNVLFVNTTGPYFNTVNLTFTTAFQSGTIYTLTVNGAKDCSGNLIGNNNTAEFILPDTANSNDIIINEVMANPMGSGTDFVELYNNSSKYIDLKNWSIASYDDDLNAISSEKTISESTSIVYPGEYVLISKDNQNILEQYPYTNDSNFIELESLPTYSNESGSVIILDNKDTIIDRFDYHEDMHFVLLDEYDGVSLERLDFDRPTQDATNWTSASEAVGFGTPGYKNSQTLVANFTGDKINVDPEVFSPDNDGYNDLLNINYELEAEGTVANISIYDAKGNMVRHLVKNELLGKSGTYSWDGINDNNEKAKVGIHVIYFEIFDVNGNVEAHKKTCVVASKL